MSKILQKIFVIFDCWFGDKKMILAILQNYQKSPKTIRSANKIGYDQSVIYAKSRRLFSFWVKIAFDCLFGEKL